MPEPVKARIMGNVTRAAVIVEAEGETQEVAALFDSVIASMARHYPGVGVELGFEEASGSDETGESGQDEGAGGSVYTTSSRRRAGQTSRTAE